METDELAQKLRDGDRAALGRAITLVESRRADHGRQAQALLQLVLPSTGKTVRLGITGVPGAGKSTTIDSLGMNLIEAGKRVAVLAVDPTSSRSGGSILGDKTRMARLSTSDQAFIRPSPTGKTLGGVARRTRETMLLCEAAGFDVIIVETVGIGQSETVVSAMVDFFLVLMVAGAGDELQGIKKGVLEIADAIIVNKADGDNIDRARNAVSDYRAALNILSPIKPDWRPEVMAVSGLHNDGLEALWTMIERYNAAMNKTGALAKMRAQQQIDWMHALINDRIGEFVFSQPEVEEALGGLEEQVSQGRLTPVMACEEVLALAGLKVKPPA